MSERPALGPVGQILVPVADVDRAVEFYERVLGLPLAFRYPGVAFFDAGVRIYLATPTEPGFNGRATFYLRTDDVSGAVEAIEARGGEVSVRPTIAHRDDAYDLWLAFVRDPDGNNVGLMREAPMGLERG
ncbi:MAG TPA: VOC family protein [Candidatus Deferrimicrobiaceae bacterium]|nr:VOC family protein [Candidatus Deferrimicrobiaceae bacterium]